MNNLIHHVRYNRWATGRTLEAVRSLTPEQFSKELGGSYSGGVRGTLTHIYQADQVWFARLMGTPTGPLSEFQPAALEGWEREWLALLDRYVAWGEGLAENDWTRVIDYRDSRGTPYQSPIWQILLHLTNHDSYHRGQVATLLRQLGQAALGTDLILYYRGLA